MFGDDNNEKKELGDALFRWHRKFSNFVYHYKWAILGGFAGIAVLLFAIGQCAGGIDPDVDIVYAGPAIFDLHEMNNIRADFHKILGEDLTGDGQIYANITRFHFLTDQQIEIMRARGEIVDINAVRIARTQLGLELLTTNNIIFFLSPEAYRAIRRTRDIENFMFVDHALGFTPPDYILFDEFTVRLSELPVFRYFEGIGAFPEDTLIAVRDYQADDRMDTALREKYERNLIMFRRIVEFTARD